MPRTRAALLLCLLGNVLALTRAKAQSSAQPNSILKARLLQRGDDMMSAWKKHDSAGIASTFAPDFVYVGGDAMTSGVDATIKALMGCEVTSYRIAESTLMQLSTDVAVLITRQQQTITCSGHPLPPVMNMTDTYVKRNGRWLILIHTETAPAS